MSAPRRLRHHARRAFPSALHVPGGDRLRFVLEEIRLPMEAPPWHRTLLLARRAEVQPLLGADDDDGALQQCHGVGPGGIHWHSRLDEIHEVSVGDPLHFRLLQVRQVLVLVVTHQAQLPLHDLRRSPPLPGDRLLIAGVRERFDLRDCLEVDVAVVEERRGHLREVGAAEEVHVVGSLERATSAMVPRPHHGQEPCHQGLPNSWLPRGPHALVHAVGDERFEDHGEPVQEIADCQREGGHRLGECPVGRQLGQGILHEPLVPAEDRTAYPRSRSPWLPT